MGGISYVVVLVLVEALILTALGAVAAVIIWVLVVAGSATALAAASRDARQRNDRWRLFNIFAAPASSFVLLMVFPEQLARIPLGYAHLSDCYETDTCSHPVLLGLLILGVSALAIATLLGVFVYGGAKLMKSKTRWGDVGAYFCFILTALVWAPTVSQLMSS